MQPEPDVADAGALRWFYGGLPPPEPDCPPAPGDRPAPPPDRVREPDERRAPPVREPRLVQPAARPRPHA